MVRASFVHQTRFETECFPMFRRISSLSDAERTNEDEEDANVAERKPRKRQRRTPEKETLCKSMVYVW